MRLHESALVEGRLQVQYHKTQAHLSPAVVNMCRQVGWSLKWRLPQLLQSGNGEDRLVREIKLEIGQQVDSASLAGSDIEELVFLVMMETAHNAEQDLNSIMDHVKAINNAKAALRKILELQMQRVAGWVTWLHRWPPS
jgi:hypothetical protein